MCTHSLFTNPKFMLNLLLVKANTKQAGNFFFSFCNVRKTFPVQIFSVFQTVSYLIGESTFPDHCITKFSP